MPMRATLAIVIPLLAFSGIFYAVYLCIKGAILLYRRQFKIGLLYLLVAVILTVSMAGIISAHQPPQTATSPLTKESKP